MARIQIYDWEKYFMDLTIVSVKSVCDIASQYQTFQICGFSLFFNCLLFTAWCPRLYDVALLMRLKGIIRGRTPP